MRIPIRFGTSERGPGRFIAPVVFIATGAAFPAIFYAQSPPLSGWRRFVPAAFGGLFVLVGTWRLVRQIRAPAARRRRQAELERHRDTPWRVRPEWRRDEIEAATSLDRSFLALALLWNLFAWPAAFFMISAEQTSGEELVWLVALFPLIGLGMLARVGVEVRRMQKFGRAVLRLDPMPPRLGRPFVGTLRAGVTRENRPRDGYRVKVSCYRQVVRYTRSSDGKRSKKLERRLLWRDETRVGDDPAVDGTAVEIPVRFTLPGDAPASTPFKTEERIIWEVAAAADTPGVDFAAAVEVPVFPAEGGVAGSSTPAGPGEADSPVGASSGGQAPPVEPYRDFEAPVTDGIELVDEQDRFELHFTAARTRRGALIMGAVGGVLILGGIPLLGASLLFGLVCIALGALLVYGSIQQGTNDTLLLVADGHVEVTHDGMGMPEDVRIPVDQVADVVVRVTSSGSDSARYTLAMVAGSPDGLDHLKEQSERLVGWVSKVGVGEDHPAMDAVREGIERPTILVANDLNDKDEADWLAERIRGALER
jgi:hypothetical protein